MNMINFVVIGYGGMGSYHTRELMKESDGIKIVGAFDIDNTRLEEAKKMD